MIVVDACTVIASALDDENSPSADVALEQAAQEGALVPGHFRVQIIHALLRAERRGRVDEATANLHLAEIEALPFEIDFPDAHFTLATARKYGLTGYDASYLALALQAHLALATVDTRLAAAAKTARCLWKAKG